jgi:DNA-binding PadR family transcriptional regulator
LWRLTAHKISEIFGNRVTKKLKGKLHTTLEQIEHGHHIFRAYFKHAFVKQYEKFSTFLRNEICSNNLSDFRLKKGLEHLAAVREKFLAITDRFATFQAQSLNVHVEFPLLQRLALPITVGTAKFPGIKIHDTRMIRLMEVLLHGGTTVGGWTAKQIHEVVLATFELPLARYGLTQLLYDLRKMKAHGLVERDGKRYAYRLTDKGTKVALTFVLFHQRLCGPLANSLFHHQPDTDARPNSKLEAAYHKADAAILNIIQLLEAA